MNSLPEFYSFNVITTASLASSSKGILYASKKQKEAREARVEKALPNCWEAGYIHGLQQKGEGWTVEELVRREEVREEEGNYALIYLQCPQEGRNALHRVVQRVRRSVRRSDSILLCEVACGVLLPGTELAAAQVVGRRIGTLLADIEYSMQIVAGSAARMLLDQLQMEQAVEIMPEDTATRELPVTVRVQPPVAETLPYLAFLSSYPSLRLLHLFPYELAHRYHCIPVGIERGIITIATSHCLVAEAIAQLRAITQRDLFQVRCEASIIDEVLAYWQRAVPV